MRDLRSISELLKELKITDQKNNDPILYFLSLAYLPFRRCSTLAETFRYTIILILFENSRFYIRENTENLKQD